ncbi:MAG: alternate-type signal peptide domain-containing protein [Bifidobacteriaceae bacterium]|jgi:alternate signal-mediated exported protein|nr:alternate-type signal peptide domain-containing protein [Bifidobacteriaceae bacterium]
MAVKNLFGSGRRGGLVRSALAAGAATAVLMGGFGAFALWSSSIDLGSKATIASGSLTLARGAAGNGAWTLENPGGVASPTPINAISNFVISPGDVLAYKGLSFTGSVTGSDIEAELQLAGKNDNGNVLIDAAANGYIVVKFDVAGANSPGTVTLKGTGSTPVYLGGSAALQTVDVYIEFLSSTPPAVAQNLSSAIDFSKGLELVLQQI